MDVSFTIFDTRSEWNKLPTKHQDQLCHRCKSSVTLSKPSSRSVKTQFPGHHKPLKSSTLWNESEVEILRQRHQELVDSDILLKNKLSILEDHNKSLEQKNNDLTKYVQQIEKELYIHRINKQSSEVESAQRKKDFKSISEELDNQRITSRELTDQMIEVNTKVNQLESELRLKGEDLKNARKKLAVHDSTLKKALQSKEEDLKAEFSIERSRLKEEIYHLEKAFRAERNNHFITTRALEQLQLHFGHQDGKIRSSLESKSPRRDRENVRSAERLKILY